MAELENNEVNRELCQIAVENKGEKGFDQSKNLFTFSV